MRQTTLLSFLPLSVIDILFPLGIDVADWFSVLYVSYRQKSEERRVEQEAIIEKQMKEIDDLSRAVSELSAKADEAVRLKDKLDEYKHAIDKLQKTENVIEKYKKKLEEGADYRRQMKVLEEQNQELLNRNKEVEQEYRKVLAFKSLMDSYKEQIMNLENKNSTLAKD
ncbi:MAG: HOOK protein-domain-containing protein, partial [Benniella sp.]